VLTGAAAIYAAAVTKRPEANIVLTGFMGTGKTTVGRILADSLGFDFVDTDELIEADNGPIPLIFAEQGEDTFRSIEHAVAVDLAERHRTVIATGGRLMLDPRNALALGETGRVFCLAAPAATILERVLGDGATRPLLDSDDPAARITELLAERAEGYHQFEQIETAGLTPEQIADEITDRILA
jgi:shikimate kinase